MDAGSIIRESALAHIAEMARGLPSSQSDFLYSVPAYVGNLRPPESHQWWIAAFSAVLNPLRFEIELLATGKEDELYRRGLVTSMEAAEPSPTVMVFRCYRSDTRGNLMIVK